MNEERDPSVSIPAGGLRFQVEYRHFGADRGPAIRVFAQAGGQEAQVLRFDCFEDDPHYHYDPSGKNYQLHLNPATVADPLAWSLGELRRNLQVMLRVAGYPMVAERIDSGAVAAALPEVEAAVERLSAARAGQRELELAT